MEAMHVNPEGINPTHIQVGYPDPFCDGKASDLSSLEYICFPEFAVASLGSF